MFVWKASKIQASWKTFPVTYIYELVLLGDALSTFIVHYWLAHVTALYNLRTLIDIGFKKQTKIWLCTDLSFIWIFVHIMSLPAESVEAPEQLSAMFFQ